MADKLGLAPQQCPDAGMQTGLRIFPAECVKYKPYCSTRPPVAEVEDLFPVALGLLFRVFQPVLRNSGEKRADAMRLADLVRAPHAAQRLIFCETPVHVPLVVQAAVPEGNVGIPPTRAGGRRRKEAAGRRGASLLRRGSMVALLGALQQLVGLVAVGLVVVI